MRSLPLVLVALVSTVRADDALQITRKWRVQVSFSQEHEVHLHSKTEGANDTVEKAQASFSFVTGTTDDDTYNGMFTLSMDEAHGLRDFNGSGTFNGTTTLTAVNGTKLTHITEGNFDRSNARANCLYTKQFWECNVGVGFNGPSHWEPNGPAPTTVASGGNLNFGIGGIHANEAGSTVTITGNSHYTFTADRQTADVGGLDKFRTHVTVTVDPLEPVKALEAVFVPDANYETWMPEGPPVAPSTHQPDTIGLHVELRDAKSHKRVDKSFRTNFVLESSKLRGDCMNWPARDEKPSDKPDIYFEAVKNKGGTVSSDELSLALGDGKGGGAIIVSSRDWGGYARLVAHVTTSDGVQLDAITPTGRTDAPAALAIPKDDNGNHIADAWDKTVHGDHSSLADDESTPSGWATRGDGYTLFEEYRGFIEADPSGTVVPAKGPKKRHMRFDPNKRDVFVGLAVADNVIALAQPGIATWAQMSSVAVHYIADPKLLAPTAGDYPGTKAFPRRADLWGDDHPELFGKPQMALWVQTQIVGDKPLEKRTPAHADPVRPEKPTPDPQKGEEQSDVFGSIGDVHGVALDLAASAATVDGIICYVDATCPIGADARPGWERDQATYERLVGKAEMAKRATWAKEKANLQELNRRFTQFTFIHELGHAAGAYHHGKMSDPKGPSKGEPTCPMRYWHLGVATQEQLDFVGGQWDLTKAPDKTAWRWCAENVPQMGIADQR